MFDGKLFHTMGPAMQYSRLLRRRLVRGKTRSPGAAERRAAQWKQLLQSRTNLEDKMVQAHYDRVQITFRQ